MGVGVEQHVDRDRVLVDEVGARVLRLVCSSPIEAIEKAAPRLERHVPLLQELVYDMSEFSVEIFVCLPFGLLLAIVAITVGLVGNDVTVGVGVVLDAL